MAARARNSLVILDKGLILFIFLNVFAFEFSIGGIPLRYILLVLLFVLTFLESPHEITRCRIGSFYVKVAIAYTILFSYSILKGNELSNMMMYFKALLMLFSIPVFSFMFRKNGVERYLNAFLISCILLIVLFLYILIKANFNHGWGFWLNNQQKLITVSFYLIPRVVIKSFVFIVPAALISFYKYPKIINVSFIFFLIIAVLSQTYGIVGAIIIIYILFLLVQKKYLSIILITFLSAFVYMLYSGSILSMLAEKEGSVGIKSQQLENIDKDMDGFEYLFGRGLGCEYRSFDDRHTVDNMLEVAGAQVFQSGGFIFSWLILYTYLFPAIWAITRFPKNQIVRQLAGSQFGILIASFSNPYIWSGGVGYSFIAMVIAYTYNICYRKNDKKH